MISSWGAISEFGNSQMQRSVGDFCTLRGAILLIVRRGWQLVLTKQFNVRFNEETYSESAIAIGSFKTQQFFRL
jgi:hypothetical protein